MPQTSAGILMYRYVDGTRLDGALEVLLAHPGGPFWRNRDLGAWTIPKGLLAPGESAEAAARREFEEELGAPATGKLLALGRVRQRSDKWVEGFALEGEFDPETAHSNSFEMEWPPRSGKLQAFPEIDRAAWFRVDEARRRILPAQAPLLDRLLALLHGAG